VRPNWKEQTETRGRQHSVTLVQWGWKALWPSAAAPIEPDRQSVSLIATVSLTVDRPFKGEAGRVALLSGSGSKVHPKPLPPSATVHTLDPQGHLRRPLAIIGKCAHRHRSDVRRNRQKN
jgi:hypothetical protein